MCQPQFLAVSFDFDCSLYYLEMVEEKAKVGTYSCSKVTVVVLVLLRLKKFEAKSLI